MAFILFAKTTNANGSYLRGDVVEIRASGDGFTVTEQSKFVRVNCEAATMTTLINSIGNGFTFQDYGMRRFFDVNFAIISSDPITDTYVIRATNPHANSTDDGFNGTRLERFTKFLTSWKANGITFGTNQCNFNIRIYDALTSHGFWSEVGLDLYNQVVFSEVSYNQTTTMHRIRADYSALQSSPTAIERMIIQHGGNIISHSARIIIYEMNRADARDKFIDTVKNGTREVMSGKKRFYITNTVMNNIEAQGGSIEATLAQIETYLKDKLAN
jgi:hypothetical protein